MKLGVLIPSRGLMHSRTVQDLLLNLVGYEHAVYISHDQPIPECFNTLVTRALAGGCSHLWLVEEDMMLPPGTLKSLLALKTLVATLDYPVANGAHTYAEHKNGVIQCGTGCLLVKREVFEELGEPYFRTDTIYRAEDFSPMPAHPHIFGMQDIDFCVRLHKAGITPKLVKKLTAGQYKVVQLGLPDTNKGVHNIETWTL